jgi:hypothetical protein
MRSNVLSIGGPRTKLLPTTFEPGSWDVICHNGRAAHGHGKPFSPFGFSLSLSVGSNCFLSCHVSVGNRRFRICTENFLLSFMKGNNRSEKSAVISNVVSTIRESSTHGGGFVRYDAVSHRWYEVGDKVARDKVGQSLRDAIRLKKRNNQANLESSSRFLLTDRMQKGDGFSPDVGVKKTDRSHKPKIEQLCSNPEVLPSYSANHYSLDLRIDSISIQGEKANVHIQKFKAKNQDSADEECLFSLEIDWNHAENLCNWFEADGLLDDNCVKM